MWSMRQFFRRSSLDDPFDIVEVTDQLTIINSVDGHSMDSFIKIIQRKTQFDYILTFHQDVEKFFSTISTSRSSKIHFIQHEINQL